MPKLYIANTSRQRRVFAARVPEKRDPIRVIINPGRQEMVYEGPSDSIEYIIEQHETYGIQPADEVKRTKAFIGLAYRIDKPITVENFIIADDVNQQALIEQGRKTREQVARYAEASVINMTRQAGEDAKSLQIEIKDMSKDNPQFHEIYSSEKPRDIEDVEPAKARRGRPKK